MTNRLIAATLGLMLVWNVTAATAEDPNPPAKDQAAAPESAPILNANAMWRSFVTMRDAVYGTAKSAEPAPVDKRSGIHYNTPLPDADWMKPDYDDSGWLRARGPFYRGDGFRNSPELALLCLRGKFHVDDPTAAGDLTLSVEFRGGAVVYLNGVEVARKALPEGKIDFETLADDLPWETYVRPDGRAIKWGWGDPQKYADRVGLRIRRIENVTIPAKLLRKGVNVLAVEVHRTAYHLDQRQLPNYWEGRFSAVGLNSLTLGGKPSEAITPNVVRPAGLQIWNANPMQATFDNDYGDPNEPLRPVRLVGTANGTFSAQVVLGSDAKVAGVSAAVGDLKSADGKATIPASACQVRYALGSHGLKVNYFDTLSPTPPAEADAANLQPVWLTVNVPADAAAGDYRGTLTVKAADKSWTVPVELHVSSWRMPDPKQWATWVDFVESPESVAMHYDAGLWSKEHFALIEKTWRQLARIGNKTIYIPLICKANFGNAQTMVRWVRKADGSYDYDYAPMEQYLDGYVKTVGKPEAVIFVVWDSFIGGGYFGAKGKEPLPIPVSLLDPATGNVSELEGPRSTDGDAAVAFLRPATDGIMERLKARGLDAAALIGIASDVNPSKEVVELWKALWPTARWVHQGHGLSGAFHGVRTGYVTTVWKPTFPADPSVVRYHGWRRANPIVCQFHRDIWKPAYDIQLSSSRLIGERNVAGNQRGFGRMSADFWAALSDGKGNKVGSISARYPISNWSQLNLRMTPYLAAGPDGALSTIRYEETLEGVQACEARILIDKALVDKAASAKLGDDLAARAQELLDERTRNLICALRQGQLGADWFVQSGWQARSGRLFDMAAAVEAKLQAAAPAEPPAASQ